MKNRPFVARERAIALSVAALCATVSAQTQAQSQTLKETVVTANLLEQRVEEAIASTALITRADIERSHATDLSTLLRSVTGVEIAQNGPRGTLSSVFMRGGNSNHTLVLVDGVAINNLSAGSASVEHLPLANIDHIEIVKGTVSSLYGSSALGGVIQIFTREGSGKSYSNIDVQVGPRGFSQQQVGAGVRMAGGTYASLNAEAVSDKGFNAINQAQYPGTNPDADGYKRKAYSGSIYQEVGQGRVGLTFRQARGTSAYDSTSGPATQKDESRFAETGGALRGEFKLRPDLLLDAAYVQSTDKLDATLTAFPYTVTSTSEGAKLGLKWEAQRGQTVTAGYEDMHSRIASDTVFTRGSLQQQSARVGYQGQFDAHTVQLNVRQDRYKNWDHASTYHAGYAYQWAPAWRLGLSSSTGFKVPTFYDLYYPGFSNPNLRPEHVSTQEASVQYSQGVVTMRATYFDSRYKDLIGLDASYNVINVNQATNKGTELSFRGQYDWADLRAGLTSQDPKDSNTGKQLARRAKQQFNLGANKTVGAWNIDTQLRYTSARWDYPSTQPKPQHLGGYALADLGLTYALQADLKAYGRVENLGNKSYQTAWGYNQPGRGLYLGLNWQPKY